jgi:hypothetical protein
MEIATSIAPYLEPEPLVPELPELPELPEEPVEPELEPDEPEEPMPLDELPFEAPLEPLAPDVWSDARRSQPVNAMLNAATTNRTFDAFIKGFIFVPFIKS